MNDQEIKQLLEQNKKLIALVEKQQEQIEELQSKQKDANGTVLGNTESVTHTNSVTSGFETSKTTLSREERLKAATEGSRTITQREPLILFVGPASCGKSMILMSLVEYLRNLKDTQYGVEANENYILNDPIYLENCEKFMNTLIENANSTGEKLPLDKTVDEVLVDINKGGYRKYSMLEAPGEDFFDIGNPRKPYRSYLKDIIQEAECPIFFVLLLDLHTSNNNFNDPNDTMRVAYEDRLIEIINDGYKSGRGDKVILLYNKFDLHDKNISDSDAKDLLFRKYYKKIKDTNAIHYRYLGIKVAERFDFLPYISGKYHFIQDKNGNEIEVYRTTREVTQKVEDLWNKLKYKEL